MSARTRTAARTDADQGTQPTDAAPVTAAPFDADQVADAVLSGDYASFVAAGRRRDAVRRVIAARQGAALMSDTDADPLATARGIAAHLAAAEAACATARPAAAPVNYAELVAARVIALRSAADALASGQVRPTGVPDEADLTDVAALADTLADLATAGYPRTDADQVAALASARVGGRTRSGVSFDVARGIAAALADEPTGVPVKVSVVCQRWAAAGGPAASAASGRVTARLFAANGCTVPGVTGVEASGDQPRSAMVTDADALAAFIADQADADADTDAGDADA